MVYLKEEDFGGAKKFTWSTDAGFSLSAISYGAIVTSIKLPDKYGEAADVVLGFGDLESYKTRNTPYLGAAVGRVANRIGGAQFQIDGKTYNLAKNIGESSLHGGKVGFNSVFYETSVDGTKVTFSYLSKDGEEGYPGNLITNITYDVTDDGVWLIDYTATSDKKTIVNLTNHSYFNLAGHDGGAQELYNHVATLNADSTTETNNESIPTGRFNKVGGTPYDLRSEKRLGELIKSSDLFDVNYCISTYGKGEMNFVARVLHPKSGRYLEVYSDQPGVQFYTSNYLPGPSEPALVGKDGVGYRKHAAFCLETQNYPDAIHHPNFPSPILKPGQVYKHRVKHVFGATKLDPVVISS